MSLRVALTALLLLQGIAGFLPGPLFWGLNHLAYMPVPVRLIWPLLGLLLLWTRAGDALGCWLQESVSPVLLGRRWVAYGLAPLLGVILFWLLRNRTHFLGDGWLLGELVARGVPFHGFDFLDYRLHAWLFEHLRLGTEPAAFQLFVVLSLVAGALYLIFAAWGARHLSDDPGERVALYALLVAFAPAQLFMGYVECYAFLAAFLLFFLAALTGHYTRGTRLYWVAAAFGAALAFHLDALFLAPLVLLPVLWPPEGRHEAWWSRARLVVLPILACLTIVAAIYVASGYNRSGFQIDFGESRRGQRLLAPLTGEESILRVTHVKDFLNLILLLAPVPLALITTGLTRRRTRGRRTRAEILLLVGSAWLLLLMLTVHMALGVARDWDLFAAQSSVFVFAGFLLWRHLHDGRPGAHEVGAVAATAFLLAVPWFWVNAGEARSLRRFEDVIADLPRFPRAYAHEEIAKYHRKAGRIPQALEEYRICTGIFPGNPRFQVALGGLLYNEGRRDESLPVFERAFAADSTYPLALEMLARVHAERGEYPTALDFARRLARRADEPARAAALHGSIAIQLQRYDEGIGAYRRALRRDPSQLQYLEQIGALSMLGGQYAQAEESFRALLRRDPRSILARAGLVEAIWEPLRRDPRQWAQPAAQTRMQEALRLAQNLGAQGQASPETRAAEGEIRQALTQLTRPPGPG